MESKAILQAFSIRKKTKHSQIMKLTAPQIDHLFYTASIM
jgi:hypothetical protein